MTAETIALRHGVKTDAIRMKVTRLRAAKHPAFIGLQYSKDALFTAEQIAAMFPKNGEQVPRTSPPANSLEKPNSSPRIANKPGEQRPVLFVQKYANKTSVPFALWFGLVLSLGTSVPNTWAIVCAIKGTGFTAAAMTLCLTISPALIIWAKVPPVWRWSVVAPVMAATAFCNAVAIFGGLTGLDVSVYLKPTIFLETVTNFFGTDYTWTARILGCMWAALIAGIEFVCVKNLSK